MMYYYRQSKVPCEASAVDGSDEMSDLVAACWTVAFALHLKIGDPR